MPSGNSCSSPRLTKTCTRSSFSRRSSTSAGSIFSASPTIAESNSTPCTLAASSSRRSCSSTCSIFRAIMPRTDSGRSFGTSGTPARDDPRAVLLDDPAGVAQVADEIDHEQRAAFRLRVDRRGEVRRKRVAGKLERQIPDDVRGRQKPDARLPRTVRATAGRSGSPGTDGSPAPCPPAGSSSSTSTRMSAKRPAR